LAQKGNQPALQAWGVSVALMVAVLAVYWPAQSFEFVNFDDNFYVTSNPRVRAGLEWDGIRWAFGAVVASMWHPLTLLSHMLDTELFGLDAGGHHLHNVLLHAANASLTFVVWRRLSGWTWCAALLALLWAVHPLQVESVAWVSERKNLVAGLFWQLTILAYVGWVHRPTALRYAGVVLVFALGLLAKPVLVTLPCVLLLLDYWPLGRLQGADDAAPRLAEKVPLLVLAVLASLVTLVTQGGTGAVMSVANLPLEMRVANAIDSYVAYLGTMLWPAGLAVYYPHPLAGVSTRTVVEAALLAAGSILAVRSRRRTPYVLVGWLWYLGTLVPNIGLVQAGNQAMADRFAYFSMPGIVLAIVWGVADVGASSPTRRRAFAALGLAAAVVLAVASRAQLATWRDSVTLFERAIAVTQGNYLAETQLGTAWYQRGEQAAAVTHYDRALAIDPTFSDARLALSATLVRTGRVPEAIEQVNVVLAQEPENAKAHFGLATALLVAGNEQARAIEHLRRATEIDPEYGEAQNNLGVALMRQGDDAEAIEPLSRAVEIDPGDAGAHLNLAEVLLRTGRREEAIVHLERTLELAPDNVLVRQYLERVRPPQ
jgi:tetratricopeptide (TPR) repeat protein